MIDSTRKKARHEKAEQAQLILNYLVAQRPQIIKGYCMRYFDLMKQACTLDSWRACYALNKYYHEWQYEDFLGWLISRGHYFFENALQNPDAFLSERLSFPVDKCPDFGSERLCQVWINAYQAKTRNDYETDDDLLAQSDYLMDAKREVEEVLINQIQNEVQKMPLLYCKFYLKY